MCKGCSSDAFEKDCRWQVLNPASMKQALVESALRIDGPHMYEQGQGKLNIIGAKVCTQTP